MKSKTTSVKETRAVPAPSIHHLDPKFGQVVLWEDRIARGAGFLPLTYLHSTHELRLGALTMLERLQHVAGRLPITLVVAERLVAVTKERHGLPVNKFRRPKPALFLNSRVVLDRTLLREINKLTPGRALVNPTGVIAFFADANSDLDMNAPQDSIEKKTKVGATFAGSLLEMVHLNAQVIESDAELLEDSLIAYDNFAARHPSVHASNPSNIWLGTDIRIGAGVVLDATEGPILLRDGAHIMPNAVIIGPASIGRNSIVKIGAKIYHGTSIGPVCKVGGEVENSILLGFSNKQHDGYLGHSYLGEWVNLGADTNTSDLRNDYAPVTLTIEGENFETGSLFAGIFCGDHTKSAINSQFNTGTVVGVSCNIFERGFPQKWIPNFSWVGGGKPQPYEIEKAISVARTVMKRRNKELTTAEETLLRSLG